MAEGHARQHAAHEHRAPGREIRSVLYRCLQVVIDEFDGIEGKGVGDGLPAVCRVSLDGVGQRVHSGGCRHHGRYGDGKLRIADRQLRRREGAFHRHLVMVFRVRDHRGESQFTPCARSRRNGNERQLGPCRGRLSLIGLDLFRIVGQQHTHRLCAVDGASASHGDQGIRTEDACFSCAFLAVDVLGVWLYAAVDDAFMPGALHKFPYPVRDAGLNDPGVRDDDGARAAEAIHFLRKAGQ